MIWYHLRDVTLITGKMTDLGREPSGYLIFPQHLYFGDSLYSSLQILQHTLCQLEKNPYFNWHWQK
ncbi:MAG: hypothetical protein OXC40_06545 [Proteobacteria bacterium]|nr:hypothetical protein [Pseudomonadota bacterium]